MSFADNMKSQMCNPNPIKDWNVGDLVVYMYGFPGPFPCPAIVTEVYKDHVVVVDFNGSLVGTKLEMEFDRLWRTTEAKLSAGEKKDFAAYKATLEKLKSGELKYIPDEDIPGEIWKKAMFALTDWTPYGSVSRKLAFEHCDFIRKKARELVGNKINR